MDGLVAFTLRAGERPGGDGGAVSLGQVRQVPADDRDRDEKGKGEVELAAFPRRALCCDSTAVQSHQLAYDRQAQADAVAGAVGTLLEGAEDATQVVGG